MKFVRIFVYLLTITIPIFAHGLSSVHKEVSAGKVAEEAHQTSDATKAESKGILQSITDTVKEYTVNKVFEWFRSMPGLACSCANGRNYDVCSCARFEKVECKSKINKSGKLIATKKGKKFCETKCLAIYDKIDAAKETIATMKSYLPFGQNLKLKARQHQSLPIFKCAWNLTGTKLICDCPRAPQFSFGKSLKTYLENTLLGPSKAARDKHKYYYPPPYYNGYGSYNNGPYNGYGYGPYNHGPYGFNPLGDLFHMIFYPLKFLFFLVTLPLWLFLLVFIGLELEDIFD